MATVKKLKRPTSSSNFFVRCKSTPYNIHQQNTNRSSPITAHPRDLVSQCEFIDESLTVLDRGNVNILKTQLDEKNRLLMYYKKRSDHFVRKNVSLENLAQALIDQRPVKFLRIDNRQNHNENEFLSRLFLIVSIEVFFYKYIWLTNASLYTLYE